MHIVIISRWIGFPNGLAPTERIRLLSKALCESGIEVTVLCLGPSERPSGILNYESCGEYQKIKYCYTSGNTVRAKFFLKRRYDDIKGIINAVILITKMKMNNKIDILYLYGTTHNINTIHLLFTSICALLKIKTVIELNELPWTLKKSTFFSRHISPVKRVNGTVVISKFLSDWVSKESKKVAQELTVIKVPILVDLHEQQSEIKAPKNMSVLFAGTPRSKKTIRFIFDSMTIVWTKYPSCKLIITGFNPEDPASKWLIDEIKSRSIGNNIEAAGYLSRSDLLNKYSEANALLIPLFDDSRSFARFPTKIGEYLAAAKPVVTNKIGEVPIYLSDGLDALICESDDVNLYANKIIEALQDPHKAAEVGFRGRLTAEKHFHYANYGAKLVEFFKSL